MRLHLLLVALLAPCVCPAEEQIHRVGIGQRSPVDGWVYPLSEHSRVVADYKAFDVALDFAQADAAEALLLLDEAHDLAEDLEAQHADLSARLKAEQLLAERASGDARRHSLYWGLGCGLIVALPWAGAELSFMDRSTALSAAAFGLSASAFVAWLTGG